MSREEGKKNKKRDRKTERGNTSDAVAMPRLLRLILAPPRVLLKKEPSLARARVGLLECLSVDPDEMDCSCLVTVS